MKILQRKLSKASGFTLVEMLIVVAIIAVLIAVSIPLVNSSLEKSRDATDLANERSAKAEAAIVFLGGGELYDEDGTEVRSGRPFYYNANTGKLALNDTGIEAYGKCAQEHDGPNDNTKFAGGQGPHEGKILVVRVDSTTGIATLEWLDSGTGGTGGTDDDDDDTGGGGGSEEPGEEPEEPEEPEGPWDGFSDWIDSGESGAFGNWYKALETHVENGGQENHAHQLAAIFANLDEASVKQLAQYYNAYSVSGKTNADKDAFVAQAHELTGADDGWLRKFI